MALSLFYALLLLSVFSKSYGDIPYSWYTFNIPPYGSESGEGIGYELADAYIDAGFKSPIVMVNVERWYREMLDPTNLKFCASGSWKLPNSAHRIYSNSIINTVDYGVAVRPNLYQQLSDGGKNRMVSIVDVLNATKSGDHLMMLAGRPIFGKMNEIIEKAKGETDTHITEMTASEGPVSMLKMADVGNRYVASVLMFPEEYIVFEKDYPDHSLEYLALSEGVSFAPIRASCPNTEQGRLIISKINQMLDDGLRDRVFNQFLDALPDIVEIRQQALINQRCIKDSSCIDPLVGSSNVSISTP